jgi:CRP-like cAMP-binding protein
VDNGPSLWLDGRMRHEGAVGASGNRILAALPADERGRLLPDLEAVNLSQGTVLNEADAEIEHVYFPVRGIAALIAIGIHGEEINAAMIGNEGMVGLPVFLGTGQMPARATVQVDIAAYRLGSAQLRAELERGGALVELLLRYVQMVLVELAQLVLCNSVHPLEQRAARSLLQINERLAGGGAPFEATQEFIAAMLGAGRPHLTAVMQSFREQELLDYRRGIIHVLDAAGLERRACACYRTIRRELNRLLATAERYDITAER